MKRRRVLVLRLNGSQQSGALMQIAAARKLGFTAAKPVKDKLNGEPRVARLVERIASAKIGSPGWARARGKMTDTPPGQKKKKPPIDLIALVARYAHAKRIPLNAPDLLDRFLADARTELGDALANPILLHGLRAESLFEATVLSLGSYRLFKTEDIGRVHADAQYRAPDFRILLEDGEQWLVEVKNVWRKDPTDQSIVLKPDYYESLRRYADALATPLRLAIFWSRWRLWTVIDPTRFLQADGSVAIEMMAAMAVTEFSRLGDRGIFLSAPLRLVLEKQVTLPPGSDASAFEERLVQVARIFHGEDELFDPRDRRLAVILLLYGTWELSHRVELDSDDRPIRIEMTAAPEEFDEELGIASLGFTSRVFTDYFATHTLEGDQIVQLRDDAAPEWFAPLHEWDFGTSRLPFRLIAMQIPPPLALPPEEEPPAP